ncbi:MAG: hypothetical protein M3384_04720 [Acidobacteriota bacterium]|nr:hypothetical protein [Acidobacteriota bacterium]
MHDDEKISEAIITLLNSNVGYAIAIFGGTLRLKQLEDLSFAVSREEFNPTTNKFDFDFEEIFSDAGEAAEFFLKKRREYELGFDFEVEPE